MSEWTSPTKYTLTYDDTILWAVIGPQLGLHLHLYLHLYLYLNLHLYLYLYLHYDLDWGQGSFVTKAVCARILGSSPTYYPSALPLFASAL